MCQSDDMDPHMLHVCLVLHAVCVFDAGVSAVCCLMRLTGQGLNRFGAILRVQLRQCKVVCVGYYSCCIGMCALCASGMATQLRQRL
jgi:hypothetical protein